MSNVKVTYVGDGVTNQFGVPFPFLSTSAVNVEVDGVVVPSTFVAPSTVQVSPAPADGATITIYRNTNIDELNYQFQLGAAFLPQYIDSNNLQLLYAAQESRATSDEASAAADTAVASAAQANLTADGAVVVANTSLSTANAASTASTQAVATATAALNTANAATTTANSASSTATAAANAAQAAVTTANAANTAAQQANATATAANAAATTAVSTANSAAAVSASATTTANNALTTANSASTAAASAVDTAGMALEVAEGIEAKADTALDAATQASVDAAAALDAVAETGVGAFNGRSGLVVPLAGDYSADMISVGSSDVATELANKAPATHTHTISQVSGLTVALDSKASVVDLQASNQNLANQILQLQNTDTALNTRLTAAESDILARVRLSGGVTGAAELPVGSTAQRPTSPANGFTRYNSTTGDYERYYANHPNGAGFYPHGWMRQRIVEAGPQSINVGDVGSLSVHAGTNTLIVNGDGVIASLGSGSAGMVYRLLFNGAVTFQHNATLILPNNVSLTTRPNDCLEFVNLGNAVWYCSHIRRGDGSAHSPMPTMHVQHRNPSGVDGGTVTAKVWERRPLNSLQANSIVGAGLDPLSGTITLPVGRYEVEADSVLFRIGVCSSRLIDPVNGVILPGSSGQSGSGGTYAAFTSIIRGVLTVTTPSTFVMQARGAAGQNNTGFGPALGADQDEIYANVIIRRIG